MYTDDAYQALSAIYRDGAYIRAVLDGVPESRDKALTVRIVYGVCERDYELEYIVNALSANAPKPTIKLLLKIGIYCLKYMNSLPDYAVVNNVVELTKKLGKKENAGYVNALLKKVARGEYEQPKDADDKEAVKYAVAKWFIKRLKRGYGEEEAKAILKAKIFPREHIRINGRRICEQELKDKLNGVSASKVGGFYVKADEKLRKLFDEGKITYQAEGSMLIAKEVAKSKPKTVLDLCAAPGGKSVYIEELTSADITAVDVYPHRVDLISSYAKRMGAKHVATEVWDGTVLNEKWYDGFDAVLVDAPCSGSGVRYSKPDIMLRLTDKGVDDLIKLQKKLLSNAGKYVKVGGTLVYSTCSVLTEENSIVAKAFIAENGNYEMTAEKSVLPHIDNCEGFYFAVLKRKE